MIKFILVCVFLFSACDYESKVNNGISNNDSVDKLDIQKERATQKVENFNLFIKKFSSDSLFQKSRINFPLNVENYNTDSESYDFSKIKENEWKFFNIKDLNSQYIKKVNKVSIENYILNIQIIDTGVFVDYIFTSKDNQWFLTKIIDKST